MGEYLGPAARVVVLLEGGCLPWKEGTYEVLLKKRRYLFAKILHGGDDSVPPRGAAG